MGKKRKLKKLFALLLSLCIGVSSVSVGVSAVTTDTSSSTQIVSENSVSGFSYRTIGTDTIEITGYTGNATEISIPSKIGGRSVTSIGEEAFRSRTNLTNITIPDSVTSIGNYAFSICTSLTSINIPDSVTNIGYRAFDGCTSLTSINIPDSVISIEGYVFNGCTNLTSITIPNSITSIGERAFLGCTSLKNITIPDGVTIIREFAFGGCTSLKNITIPDSVTIIGEGVFEGCKSLTNIIIPDSVTSILWSTFSGCRSLTNITIPNSVTSIELFAFAGCTNLTSINIPDSVTNIDGAAFSGCTSLTNITIPDGVTSIGNWTFDRCTSLTNITIPDSVTSIGNGAFRDCTSLTEVAIPNSVTSIGEWVFRGCTSLTSITIPNSVTSIEDFTFNGCTNLTNVNIPNSVTSIGRGAFADCASLKNINIPDSVISIGNGAFYNCKNITNITIPNSVKSIGDAIGNVTFFNCNSLKDIYYSGTKEEWEKIYKCDTGISSDVIIHYNYFQGDNSGKSENLSPISSSVNDKNYKPIVLEYKTLNRINNAKYSLKENTLNLSADGYYNVSIGNYTASSQATLALVPESTKSNIAAVYCNNKDALLESCSFNQNEEIENIKAYPAISASEIKEYRLYAGDKYLKSSTDGSFGIAPYDVDSEDPLCVSIQKKDGTVCPKIQTNITVKSTPNISLEFDNGFSIDVPSDVPLIGGMNFKLDLTDLPVQASFKDDTFCVGFGYKKDLLDNSDKKNESNEKNDSKSAWQKFRDMVNMSDADIRDNVNDFFIARDTKSSIAMKQNPMGINFAVFGYAEGKYKNGQITNVSGKLKILLTFKYEQQWQCAIVNVPVVLKLKFEAGAATTMGVDYDIKNQNFTYVGEVEFTLPAITASAGVGIANIADLSIYGSAKNVINLCSNYPDVTATSPEPHITATLSGEFGLSATIFFFSYKLPILSGDWTYYDNKAAQMAMMSKRRVMLNSASTPSTLQKNIATSDNYTITRADTSKWVGTTDSSLSENQLQSNVYENANPKVVKTDKTTMMVWTADISSRTAGNNTAVVYSLYDETNKTWSSPKIVHDDETADVYPDVATDGKDIYITWTNVKKKLDSNTSIDEVAKNCEILVAKFDASNNKFINVKRVTVNNTLDTLSKICVKNGVPYLTWINNSNNDILTLSGTNRVKYAYLDNGEYVVKTYKTVNSPIKNINIGELNNNIAIAYTVDKSSEDKTADDIYAGYVSSTPKCICAKAKNAANIMFEKLEGISNLVWYSDSSLKSTSDLKTVSDICSDSEMSSNYSILNGNGKTVIVSVKSNDKGNNIVAANCVSGKCTDFVSVTNVLNDSKYIKNPNGYIDKDGNLCLTYSKTEANISEDTIKANTALCYSVLTPKINLSVNSVNYDYAGVKSGEQLTLTANITNNGLNTSDGCIIGLYDNEGKLYCIQKIAESFKSGESADVKFDITVPSDIDGLLSYKVLAMSSNTVFNNDISNMNYDAENISELKIGYTDLAVNVDKILSSKAVSPIITIKNNSCIDTSAKLLVRKNSPDGKILKEYNLEKLLSGQTYIYNIDASVMNELLNSNEVLYFEAVSDKQELFKADNNSFISTDELKALTFSNKSTISKTTIYIGDKIILNGSAEGGTESYTYAYYYKKSADTKWTLGKNYSSEDSYTFTPKETGTYDICIKVKDTNGTVAKKYFKATVKSAALKNNSTVSSLSVSVGDKIILNGSAEGGTKSYTYAYYYKKSADTKWTLGKNYSSANSYTFTPKETGTYDICIKVKDTNGTVAKKYFKANVKSAALKNNSTVSSLSISVGDKIILNGSAEGGTKSYTYAYYYKKSADTKWTLGKNYSSANSYTFTPKETGTYDICIKVKDTNGTVAKKYFTLNSK